MDDDTRRFADIAVTVIAQGVNSPFSGIAQGQQSTIWTALSCRRQRLVPPDINTGIATVRL